MLLSACYIVKNEQENLAKSIISIRTLVDEIIVIDTGSGDNTVAIAQQYTDKIFYYKWQDDFAAARNFALSKARGEWIIFPDADEYAVINNIDDIRMKLQNIDDIDAYLVKIVNIDSRDNKYLDEFYAQRLFKKENILYSGKIHEHLKKKTNNTIISAYLSADSIFLYHTGYSASLAVQKAQRNLKLLLTMDKDNPITMIELAEAYNGINDDNNALYYANKAVRQGRQNITYASRPYRLLIALLQKKQAAIIVIKKAIEAAMLDFPDLPDFCAEYGALFFAVGEYKNAAKYMKKALQLQKKYQDIEPSIFDKDKQIMAQQIVDECILIITRMQSIKISACIIVKNEEKNIKRWYDSVSQCSDEQIVVDTGSTDGTIEIIKKLPAKLYKYKWCNDFAAAKNYAIDKAIGDWIIFIDADQYFSEKTVDKVRSEITKADIAANNPQGLFIMEVNIEENNNKEIGRSYSVRVFRNEKDLRYEGAVHEELRFNHHDKFTIAKNDLLQIYHTGYSDNYSKVKAKRNLAILLSEKYDDGVKRWHYIADCYYGLGNYQKTVECIEKYFSEGKYEVINGASNIWNTYINAMIKLNKNVAELCLIIKKAIDKFPHLPDFYALMGIVLFNAGKYKEAKEYLLKAIKTFKGKNTATIEESSSFAMYLPTTQECLKQIAMNDKNKLTAKNKIERTDLIKKGTVKMSNSNDINAVIKETVENIQWLFLSIISQDSLQTEYQKYLIEGIWRIILRYFNQLDKLNSTSDFETYEALYAIVIKNAEINVVERYIDMAKDFTLELRGKIVKYLADAGKWNLIHDLLADISIEQLNSELLYDYALSFYYLDELQEAKKYLLQAQKLGCSKKEIDSYLVWIDERSQGKW